jgi:hypothetical protein
MAKLKTIKTAFRGAFSPASYNEEKNTLDVTFTTSAPYRRYDWRNDEEYDEVLSFEPGHVKLDRLNMGAPVLTNPDRYGGLNSQIGVVERAWVENGQGGATIRLSKREDIKGIVQDVRDGIIKNISIGYEVRAVQREDRGKGKRPIYRAIDWEPFEISLVPIPADPMAQVRSVQDQMQEVEIIEPEQERELEDQNTDATGVDEVQEQTMTVYNAQIKFFNKKSLR